VVRQAVAGALAAALSWLPTLLVPLDAAAQPQPVLAAASAPTLTQQIEHQLDIGRTRREAGEAALIGLLDARPGATAERLEVLAGLGQLLTLSADSADRARPLLPQLEAWPGLASLASPAGPTSPAGKPAAASAPDLPAQAHAVALLLRSRLASLAHEPKEADRLASQALATLPPTSPPAYRLRVVHQLARLRADAGRVEDAMRLHLQALTLADQIGQPSGRADARRLLAYNHLQTGSPAQAAQRVAEAIGIATQAQDWYTLALAQNTAAILADASGDLPTQRRMLEAALQNTRRVGARDMEALYLANLSNVHLTAREYPQAWSSASLALPLARQTQDITAQVVALANMGLAQIGMRRINEGRQLLDQAIEMERKRARPADVADLYQALGLALEAAGETTQAVAALHEYRRLADELFHRDNQREILKIQAQFDATQRETTLGLLNRENRLKAEALDTSLLRQHLGLLLGGVALVAAALLGLGVHRVRDASRRLRATNAELDRQGSHDPLTGLANRRQCRAVMDRLGPDGLARGALLLIDIDHFKRLNDSHGHAAGDAVLVVVAQRLRQVLGLADDDAGAGAEPSAQPVLAGGGPLIARWGGEEFLVCLPALDDVLLQRLMHALRQPVLHAGQSIPLGASIGLARFPLAPAGLPVSWHRAMRLVDAALYLAKAGGRGRACTLLAWHGGSAALEAVEQQPHGLADAAAAGRASLAWWPSPPLRDGAPAAGAGRVLDAGSGVPA